MMEVLLVSDDVALTEKLTVQLKAEGHELSWVSYADAEQFLTLRQTDLLLYDLSPANHPHWGILAKLARYRVPKIVIGPEADAHLAVAALRSGADDYVPRPLHISELLARMEALLRRMREYRHRPNRMPTDTSVFTLDRETRGVWIGQRHVALTATEYALLESLAQHHGEPVSRADLARQVWGADSSRAEASLSLHIWKLHRKIETNPAHPEFLITRWGQGYCLLLAPN